jgi:hypothetical protein
MEAPRRVILKRTRKRIKTMITARARMTFKVPAIRSFLTILTPIPSPEKKRGDSEGKINQSHQINLT